jgi:DNA polymerase III alpha subunit
MPNEYKELDIESFLINECTTESEISRVKEEIVLFRKHNMINLLRFLKYLVDTMRKNNVLWGVGRGSSVASYCLYLLGIHKIDSLKYQLDIKEFLR